MALACTPIVLPRGASLLPSGPRLCLAGSTPRPASLFQALTPGREYGDAGGEDLTPDDVAAMLERHVRTSALSPARVLAQLQGPGLHAKAPTGEASVLALEAAVRAELGSDGAERGSRREAASGCVCCLVDLARAPGGEDERADYLCASLRLMGARAERAPRTDISHLICVREEGGGELGGAALLEALSASPGAEPACLQGLRARLCEGACRLVDGG